MRHTTFLPHEGTNYQQIAFHAMHGTQATEISYAEYQYALNVMPPIYVRGGFCICEATCDSAMGPVHSMYAKFEGRYFSKYVVLGRKETYLMYFADAYPIDYTHEEAYKEYA